jgi:hypothetical protein
MGWSSNLATKLWNTKASWMESFIGLVAAGFLSMTGWGPYTVDNCITSIAVNLVMKVAFTWSGFDALSETVMGNKFTTAFKWVFDNICKTYTLYFLANMKHGDNMNVSNFFSAAFFVGFLVLIYLINSMNAATNYMVETKEQQQTIADLRMEIGVLRTEKDSAKATIILLLAQKKTDIRNERVALAAQRLVNNAVFAKALKGGKTRVCECGFHAPGKPCTRCTDTANLTSLEVAVGALGGQVAVGAL